jgi:hypothetical protein
MSSALSVLERPGSAAARFDPPSADEHDPYYSRYISRVPAGDFLAHLRGQADTVVRFFGPLSPEQGDFAYAPGKWTVKEVLGHLIDAERVFAFRALSIARQDPSPLPDFDQDVWVAPAACGRRSLPELVAEWTVVRAATVALADGLPAEAPLRRGIAAGKEISVRALLYVPVGHLDYHLDQLRARYLAAPTWPR